MISSKGIELILLCTLAFAVGLWIAESTYVVRWTNNAFVLVKESLRTKSCARASEDERRYITTVFVGVRCCGTANHIFEFVSAIGIARKLNRTLYVKAEDAKVIGAIKTLSRVFPNLPHYFVFRFNKLGSKPVAITITEKCCEYGNMSLLEAASNESEVIVDSPFLQSFKYFDDIKEEILNSVLKFSATIEEMADEELFPADVLKEGVHRVCVHTRREDTVGTYRVWSTENYTVAAATYVADKVLKTGKNVTVLVFGDDREWMRKLPKRFVDDQSPFPVFVARSVNNIEHSELVDISFVQRHCHSIILTESSSTFGWWMAYMGFASSNATVYYRREVSLPDGVVTELRREDFFPPQWNVLSDLNVIDEAFNSTAQIL